MKAITILQPWTSLLAEGKKRIETRSWRTNYRGEILLHAGKGDPLVKNVSHGHSDWKLTTCPECGRDCWRMPLADIAEATGAIPLCTECALKKGAVKS